MFQNSTRFGLSLASFQSPLHRLEELKIPWITGLGNLIKLNYERGRKVILPINGNNTPLINVGRCLAHDGHDHDRPLIEQFHVFASSYRSTHSTETGVPKSDCWSRLVQIDQFACIQMRDNGWMDGWDVGCIYVYICDFCWLLTAYRCVFAWINNISTNKQQYAWPHRLF